MSSWFFVSFLLFTIHVVFVLLYKCDVFEAFVVVVVFFSQMMYELNRNSNLCYGVSVG